MNKKKRVALAIFLMALFDLLIFVCVPNEKIAQIEMNITLESDETGDYQVFYSKDGIFSMEQMQTIPYEVAGEKKVLSYVIPVDKNIWRVDFGDSAATVKVHAIELKSKGHKVELNKTALVDSLNWNGLVGITDKDKYVEVKTTNADPRCVLNVQEVEVKQFITNVENDVNRVKRIIACVMLDIVVFAICLLGNKIYSLIKEVFQNRKLVFKLAKNDFKTRFVGSYLGIIWAFIQPVVTVLVYWFVFQVGLRSGDVGDFPFVLWLIAGLVPWFFFQEALSSGTNALIEYQYLVKKIVFKISTLPVVKVLSALFVHLFFILFTLVLYSFYGYFPDLYTLQVLYYTFCAFVFALALVYLTCSVVIFFRDITQIISIVLQVGVWMTPIMWQVSILPKQLIWFFKLNPMYYIVSGYRDALINKVWFWDNFYMTIWFWFITLGLFGIGTIAFKRLKVHFADVL